MSSITKGKKAIMAGSKVSAVNSPDLDDSEVRRRLGKVYALILGHIRSKQQEQATAYPEGKEAKLLTAYTEERASANMGDFGGYCARQRVADPPDWTPGGDQER
ncbi:hypothetical protein ACFLT5_04150 [Chloroflexota bacterium]